MKAEPNRARSLSQIFAVPLVIGCLSAFGLVVALIGDDAWDVAGWLTLAVPLIVAGWCLARSRRTSGQSSAA